MDVARGTIFKNTHQSLYDTYLIYLYSFGSNSYCIKVMVGNSGRTDIEWNCRMFKHSLMNDRELFPIVGAIDLDNMIKDVTLNIINQPSVG